MPLCKYVNKGPRAGPDAVTDASTLPRIRQRDESDECCDDCCRRLRLLPPQTPTTPLTPSDLQAFRPGAQYGDWTRAGHGCVDGPPVFHPPVAPPSTACDASPTITTGRRRMSVNTCRLGAQTPTHSPTGQVQRWGSGYDGAGHGSSSAPARGTPLNSFSGGFLSYHPRGR